MDVQLWSDVAVDISTAFGAAKPITAITKADPPVASATAHGYTAGDIVLLKTTGMLELDYAVIRVGTVTTDTFQIEGVDATLFKTFLSGTAEEITFGLSAETFTEVSAAGGESEQVPIQTIHRRRAYNIPGNESPLVFTFGSLWIASDPVLQALVAASRARANRAVRFTFADGSVGLFAGIPSASLAPGGSAGAPVTTPVVINCRGPFQPYEAA